MKLKIAGIVCFAALVGILSFSLGRAQTTPKPSLAVSNLPGRYQLTTATIEKIVPEPQRVVFRTDSETGQVWMLALHADAAGHESFFWDPISEGDVQPK